MPPKSEQLIKLSDLLKEERINNREPIAPVINPFFAFVLYIVAVHYFCFCLWPLVYWKICVHFNLLERLSGREFLVIASKVSISTGLMMLPFFFSAGYNTTNKGATQQYDEPAPIYLRLVYILNNSKLLTFSIWLAIYGFLIRIIGNNDTHYADGSPMPQLEVMWAYQAFPDFPSYCRVFLVDVDMIYFPFNVGSILALACLYFLLMILFLLCNGFPFFILIESFNRHFWQKVKPSATPITSVSTRD